MTQRVLMRTPALFLPLAALFALGGCGEGSNTDQAVQAQQGVAGTPPGGGEGVASEPGIKQIMGRLTKGPNSLTPVLGRELKEAEPPWETIQSQSKEYARLAGDMAKYDPPKGSKESWEKLTSAYTGSAVELERSAQARDKDAALTAHGALATSCMACHREHRKMGPGMGGPPGSGPGGPPGSGPGGPPPGGPPGS